MSNIKDNLDSIIVFLCQVMDEVNLKDETIDKLQKEVYALTAKVESLEKELKLEGYEDLSPSTVRVGSTQRRKG